MRHLSPTHTLLLNKFNVVAHHLICVTREFEQQTKPLNTADLEATWTAMQVTHVTQNPRCVPCTSVSIASIGSALCARECRRECALAYTEIDSIRLVTPLSLWPTFLLERLMMPSKWPWGAQPAWSHCKHSLLAARPGCHQLLCLLRPCDGLPIMHRPSQTEHWRTSTVAGRQAPASHISTRRLCRCPWQRGAAAQAAPSRAPSWRLASRQAPRKHVLCPYAACHTSAMLPCWLTGMRRQPG